MKRKIVLIVVEVILAAAIIGAIWCLTVQIATPIKWEKDRKSREETVIKKLKDIRLAQRTYKSKYQRFTADFDTLTNFILTEQMEGERKLIDEDDSVAMAQARKKYGKKFKNVEKFTFSVKDSLFKHLSVQQIKELRYIPYTDNQKEFYLEAQMLATESKVIIPVVECRAPYKAFLDLNKYRQEIINLIDENVKMDKYPGLKFGDLNRGSNEAGNWE